jgi:hypothetical protein
MKISYIVAAAGVALLSASAQAVNLIPGLFNTGVNAASVSTTGNGADPHWTFQSSAAFNGGTNGNFPIPPWLAENTVSRWATPTSNAADTVFSGAYSTVFNLGSFGAGTFFSGRFAADDSVTSITLNGNAVTGTGGGFTDWTPFSSVGGFQIGANTLTFNVFNSGGGPSGLRVEVINAAVPEPQSWALLIAGFGLVGLAARRRRSVVAG